jgi:hypothetical protein
MGRAGAKHEMTLAIVMRLGGKPNRKRADSDISQRGISHLTYMERSLIYFMDKSSKGISVEQLLNYKSCAIKSGGGYYLRKRVK